MDFTPYQEFAKEKLGFEFNDINLLVTALTHRSYVNEHKSAREHNERLEFVWDAILGSIIAKKLFLTFPEMSEAQMTLYKIALVREETLSIVAKKISLNVKTDKGKSYDGDNILIGQGITTRVGNFGSYEL